MGRVASKNRCGAKAPYEHPLSGRLVGRPSRRCGAVITGIARCAPVVKLKGLVPDVRHGGASHAKTRRERQFIASPVRSALV